MRRKKEKPVPILKQALRDLGKAKKKPESKKDMVIKVSVEVLKELKKGETISKYELFYMVRERLKKKMVLDIQVFVDTLTSRGSGVGFMEDQALLLES